ncbi:MAG TPA: hypothetical protein VLH16_03615 [Bacteroidales bacterium]|nr:hypothetical protein [Bacteroidales bacterium]
MIIRLFKSSYFLKLFSFILISLGLWAGAFVNPPSYTQDLFDGFIWHLLPGRFIVPAFTATILAFLLLVAQALYLNNILTAIPLFSQSIFFPALLFVMLGSFDPNLLTLHDGSIISLLLVLSFRNLLHFYDKDETIKEAFNAAFWMSVASLFHIEAAVMMLFVWGSFVVCRLTAWREWVVSLLGFATPWLLIISALYLTDGLKQLTGYFTDIEAKFSFAFSTIHLKQWIFFAAIAFLLLLSLVKIESEIHDKVISIRKNLAVVKVMLFVGVLSFVAGLSDPSESFYLMIPPSTVVMAYFFMARKKLFWAELFFSLLLALIVTFRFI